jgi:hypothetical protein
VITEEVHQGPLPRLLAPVLRAALRRYHQEWLRALADQGRRPTGDRSRGGR